MVMAVSDPDSDSAVLAAVRRQLLRIASREDDLAAAAAALVPYWASHPPSVQGHRAAAAALRSEADRLLRAS
jgi:hypothetical protein